MVDFDFEQFAQGNFSFENAGLQFGLPACLIDIGNDVLRSLPGPELGALSTQIATARRKAREYTRKVLYNITKAFKIIEYDEDTGLFKINTDFLGDSSTSRLSDFLTTTQAYIAGGYEIYQNLLIPVEQVTAISNCIDQLNQSNSLSQTGLVGASQVEVNTAINQIKGAQQFIQQADAQLAAINDVLNERIENPNLEPIFNVSAGILSGTLLDETLAKLDEIEEASEQEIFRLVFGPPKATKGQFILTVDGLYYDSQSSGIPQISGIIAPEDRWVFDYDPNLGGKGEVITLRDLDRFVDTIFDLDRIDDSEAIRPHYDADNPLQVLIGQKNKHILDLSGQLTQLLTDYSITDAVVINKKQEIQSVAAKYQSQIDRRKKQIEIAIRAPQLFGGGALFDLGEVPINDFSYLSKINIATALEKQRKLVFKTADVDGIIKPIQPKFVTSDQAQQGVVANHLIIPRVDKGGIVFSDANDVSATEHYVLGINDQIYCDNLIAVYNFLNSDTVQPGSDKFTVINSKVEPTTQFVTDAGTKLFSNSFNAQLIGNASEIFPSGLAVPYFQGITKYDPESGSPSGLGSFMVLPDVKPYQNLMYNPEGFSFSFWIHMPSLMEERAWGLDGSLNASALHRIIIGNENIGGSGTNVNANEASLDTGSDVVRGALCGFTIDSRITGNRTLSNQFDTSTYGAWTGVQDPGPYFYLAPTRSVNASTVEFVSRNKDCDGTQGVFCFKVPVKDMVQGVSLSSMCSGFMMLTLDYDTKKDSVTLYANSGTILATSSIPQSFGLPSRSPLLVPSFKARNSFEYSLSSTNSLIFRNGPKLNSFFTPWIIGGGWTDGMVITPQNASGGGFMGTFHGRQSGLKGYLGSMKIYSSPIGQGGHIKNYDSQRQLFEVIPAPCSGLNVAVIIFDDVDISQFGLYSEENIYSGTSGYPYPYMPNLSAVATSGVRFTQARCQPACSPSRMAFMSGKYGFRTGGGSNVNLNQSSTNWKEFNYAPAPINRLLPESMQAAGYSTGMFGKWHMNLAPSDGGRFLEAPSAAGFQHWEGIYSNLGADIFTPDPINGVSAGYYNYNWFINGTTSSQVSTFATQYTFERAAEWANNNANEPWFIYLPLNGPHKPLDWPPVSSHGFGADPSGTYDDGVDSTTEWVNTRFRAHMESIDHYFGLFKTAIGDQVNRTLFIFIGDNGVNSDVLTPQNSEVHYPIGHPLHFPGADVSAPGGTIDVGGYKPSRHKLSPYEGGIRTALVAGGAGVINPNRDSSALVHITDIYDTCLDIAQQGRPPKLDGFSFKSQLLSPLAPHARTWSLSERFTPNGVDVSSTKNAIRRGYVEVSGDDIFKLTVFDNEYELYHLAGPTTTEDVYEDTNLSGTYTNVFNDMVANYISLLGGA